MTAQQPQAITPEGPALPDDEASTYMAIFVSRAPVQAAEAQLATARLLGLADAGPVTLGVEWCYELHELVIRPRTWRRLVQGERLGLTTTEAFEGRRMRCFWGFDGLRSLDVSYRNGHDAYSGGLGGCRVRACGEIGWRLIDAVAGPGWRG